jgi:hypothetical protein
LTKTPSDGNNVMLIDITADTIYLHDFTCQDVTKYEKFSDVFFETAKIHTDTHKCECLWQLTS